MFGALQLCFRVVKLTVGQQTSERVGFCCVPSNARKHHAALADGKFTAPLWESASAQEALAKARRVLRKK